VAQEQAEFAGTKVQFKLALVLPSKLSQGDRRNAEALVKAGVQVRYLGQPYPHAKLIVADDQMFLGSQNISVSSLDKNREVGMLVSGSPVGQAEQRFEKDFEAAGQ